MMNDITPAKIDKIMANTILPTIYCNRLFSNDLIDKLLLNSKLVAAPIKYPPLK
jgi:hypothetical protein